VRRGLFVGDVNKLCLLGHPVEEGPQQLHHPAEPPWQSPKGPAPSQVVRLFATMPRVKTAAGSIGSPGAFGSIPSWQQVFRRKIRRLGCLNADSKRGFTHEAACFRCNNSDGVIKCSTCSKVCHPECMIPARAYFPTNQQWFCPPCTVSAEV
jgi:hypothetical protein